MTGVPRLRAVLLDAAGTLIHPGEPLGETYARHARAQGVDVPAARLEEAFRRVLRSAPPMLFPGRPPARVGELERAWWRDRVRETFRAADQMARFTDFEACFEALFAHFARPDAWRSAPGAASALTTLGAEGRRLAVVSNFDQRLPGVLEGLGLARHFDLVWLPAEAGCAKPDPRLFQGACQRLGVAPQQAVSVGDDPEQDLRAARAAGLRAIDVGHLATLAELPSHIHALEEETCP